MSSMFNNKFISGRAVLFRRTKRALRIPLKLPLFILAVPVVVVIRLIKPWLLVRWGGLVSSRIGHFAANTEMYLCEQDAGINVPRQRHVDLFFNAGRPICNQQLAKMWKRILRIWPVWILDPICRVNRMIPGGAIHETANDTQHGRDVHNLLDRSSSHLIFTPEEEARGEAGLRAMGIPPGTPFVCLHVRDSAYLDAYLPGDWRYHNYRDSDIRNYVLAAEELANRGYYVIRMGAKVRQAMKTADPHIVDYATNGMRSEFLDIYLGAKCAFCVTTGSGWDSVPAWLFRKPIVYTNYVPLGYLCSFISEAIIIAKRHYVKSSGQELSLRRIFYHGVGFGNCNSDYESKDVKLVGNTPEEILDVVIEMAERLNGTWQPNDDDEGLQRRFWNIFPANALEVNNKRPLHGEIRARFGAAFLRNNSDWLK